MCLPCCLSGKEGRHIAALGPFSPSNNSAHIAINSVCLPYSCHNCWQQKVQQLVSRSKGWNYSSLTRGLEHHFVPLLTDGILAVACFLWACDSVCHSIKLELSVPERSEGNGRWQSRAFSVDSVSLFNLKHFKNWFCWGVAQRTTNIHYACFFSILRNYMQMTLRSINHIGFHFTNGWLYVNPRVLFCCFLHYF